MTLGETLFSMKFNGKQKVAQLGEKGLYEYSFDIEKTYAGNKNLQASLLEVEQIWLLPAVSDESFITLKEASLKSGLTSNQLKELCGKGELTGITRNRKWFILKESLDIFLNETNGTTEN